jgi:hypothetical protein
VLPSADIGENVAKAHFVRTLDLGADRSERPLSIFAEVVTLYYIISMKALDRCNRKIEEGRPAPKPSGRVIYHFELAPEVQEILEHADFDVKNMTLDQLKTFEKNLRRLM